MGCISTKLRSSGDLRLFSGAKKSTSPAGDGNLSSHIVSLTSSTYGVLNLDPFEKQKQASAAAKGCLRSPPSIVIPVYQKMYFADPSPEIIDWVLGEDPEDSVKSFFTPEKKRSIRPPALFTPSPKLHRKFFGKENSRPRHATPTTDPNRVLKPLTISEKKQPKTPRSLSGSNKSSSRRSLSPIFDPELIASFERELREESERIKRIVVLPAAITRKEVEERDFLRSFEEKCPLGGEKAVVLYTTTLRGIRKTFEECNAVRSVIGAHNVCVIERDISMDLVFREELRKLMGSKDVRPPVLFVKGRLVGGAAEVVRLEEEGKLELLMEGIPRAARCCEECGGLRFVMCKECNGSCKVLEQGEKKKKMKCSMCNENGLVYCPSCTKTS